jgi:hypothetical protein
MDNDLIEDVDARAHQQQKAYTGNESFHIQTLYKNNDCGVSKNGAISTQEAKFISGTC